MEYIVTTNKNDLNLDETDYNIFFRGKFHINFRNENSIFISNDLLDVICDLLSIANKKYSRFSCHDFTFYNYDQINIFENELMKRLRELKGNKEYKIPGEYKDYINEGISKHLNKIVEMLDKLIIWIKSNKENGITVLFIYSQYKLRTIDTLPDDTCYFEFLPGKYQDKCWNENSVFIEEEIIYIIEDLLYKSNKNFDRYELANFYDSDQLNILEQELSKRLNEIKDNKEYNLTGTFFVKETYVDINKDIKIYYNDIIEMLNSLIVWIKSNKENGITVIGI
jgi:hypothetical protein